MIKLRFIFILLSFAVSAQKKVSDINIRKQLEDYNSSFASAFIKGDNNGLLKSYTNSSVFMPEHSRQRIGRNEIASFYQQWLTDSKVTFYQKTIFELQDIGNCILEIGNFTENLHKKDDQSRTYKGKYMVIWKPSLKKGQPMTIVAEIWGSDSYIDDKLLPEIEDKLITVEKEYLSSDKLTAAIKEQNNKIKKLVQERSGIEHAKLFMPDAIYMTYYTPMLIGSEKISNYFNEHEKPGFLNIDAISIKTSGIIEKEKAVIEFGFYSVDWSDGSKKGNVKGKSINIWKKNSEGEFKLFRQIVNHD